MSVLLSLHDSDSLHQAVSGGRRSSGGDNYETHRGKEEGEHSAHFPGKRDGGFSGEWQQNMLWSGASAYQNPIAVCGLDCRRDRRLWGKERKLSFDGS